MGTRSNKALWLVAKAKPLKLGPSTYTSPGDNEMVVKTSAIAINPYDHICQEAHNLAVYWVKLPFILGTDVAGEIVDVGKNVTRFRVGDRVVGHAIALDKRVNKSSEGGFQEYPVLRESLTTPIPHFMSYETACVLPLALSTAACALFMKENLALPYPTISPTPSGKTLLIWGGATSVGCNAIQLTRSAGYEVITTASPKNHAYLKKLGAAECFDYNSPTVVQDIIKAMKQRKSAGALSITRNAVRKCIDIISACDGNKFVAQTTLDAPPFPKGTLDFPPFVVGALRTVIGDKIKASMKSCTVKLVNGSDTVADEVGKVIYDDYLPQALEQGKFVPAPDPQVVGTGLESIQEAMNICKKGVSAKKIVVTM